MVSWPSAVLISQSIGSSGGVLSGHSPPRNLKPKKQLMPGSPVRIVVFSIAGAGGDLSNEREDVFRASGQLLSHHESTSGIRKEEQLREWTENE